MILPGEAEGDSFVCSYLSIYRYAASVPRYFGLIPIKPGMSARQTGVNHAIA